MPASTTIPTVAECREKLEALKSDIESVDPGARRDALARSVAAMEELLNRIEVEADKA